MTDTTAAAVGAGGGLAILGAGGAAREVYWYARALGIDPICFVDDVSGIEKLAMASESIPVVSDWQRFEGPLRARFPRFATAVGNPAVRKLLTGRALAAGLVPADPLVHPRATICGTDCRLGAGTVLAPGVVVTTSVDIGEHVLVHYNATIGHDTRIGVYGCVNPGANISGNVTIGSGVLVGAGSTIREKVTIADGCTIGAQALVIDDILTPGMVVGGVPARPLRRP